MEGWIAFSIVVWIGLGVLSYLAVKRPRIGARMADWIDDCGAEPRR